MTEPMLELSMNLILAAATCAALATPDERAYCRAVESGSPARCMEIQNPDLRTRCRVELGDNPANCQTIIDKAQRELCKLHKART